MRVDFDGGSSSVVTETSNTFMLLCQLFVRLIGFGILVLGILVGLVFIGVIWAKRETAPNPRVYDVALALIVLFTAGGGVANVYGRGTGLLVSFASGITLVVLGLHWWLTKE